MKTAGGVEEVIAMDTTTDRTSLLDAVMPAFHFRSRHTRRVAAPPEWTAQAVERLSLGRAASLLFRLRGISLPSGSIRDALERSGFAVLAEDPGTEVVAGTNGRFWAVRELAHMERPRDAASFRAFDRPGWAQGAISVRIDPLPDGASFVSTETRVRCVDGTARRRFALYWTLIEPFSGWLRRDFLRRVALVAEGAP